MQHLGELNLSHNCFEEFDINFCQLRALRKFYLNHNQLSTMPGDFWAHNLEVINV